MCGCSGDHGVPEYIKEEDEWMYKCVFVCKECKVSFNQKDKFDKHIMVTHDLMISEHKKHSGGADYLKKEIHNCKISTRPGVFNCDLINEIQILMYLKLLPCQLYENKKCL